MDTDFTIRYEAPASKRGAFRASVPGLQVALPGGVLCQVKDLSAGGVGFSAPQGEVLAADSELQIDLLVADKLYVGALTTRIVRVTPEGTVACSFGELSRSQEMRLDKLVLEMQKRLIALRKAKEAAEIAKETASCASGGACDEKNAKETEPIILDVP